MLIAKGYACGFDVEGRRGVLWLPARAEMLHDPSGRAWPRCSLLFSAFQRGEREASPEEYAGAPKYHLESDHVARIGVVDLPPRALTDWEELGELRALYYKRPGTRAPGAYRHNFNAPRGSWKIVFALKKKGAARLFKRGSLHRVELGSGCIVDDRGIAFP